MKNFPHTIIVLILMSVALLAFGCEQKAEVTQDQQVIEESAPKVAEQTETVEVTAPVEPAKEARTDTVAPEPAVATEEAPPATIKTKQPEPTTTQVKSEESVAEVAEETTTEEQPAEQSQEAAGDEIAVTVDGVIITEAQLDERIDQAIQRRKKQGMPAEMEQQERKRARPSLLQGMITEAVLDAEIEKLNIQPPTPDEIEKEIDKIAAQRKWTRDELVEQLQRNGQTLDDMKAYYEKALTYRNLLYSQYADECKITDEEAKQYYDSRPANYNIPERVRASHILIKPDTSDPNADPNDTKAAAKAKAEVLLKQIKDGADFAELAKENSACPSASNGGDLNFFTRGQMTPPFEEAAFSLEDGQISGVVETQFGFHIIKVTDKQEAKVTSFDEAKAQILDILRSQKENRVGGQYLSELKAKAKIEYPEGKGPEAEAKQPDEGGYQETQ